MKKLKTKLQSTLKNVSTRYKSLSKNKQRLTAVVTILLVASLGQIVISSFAATREYSNIPQVAEMQHLTEQVIADANNYSKLQASSTNDKKNPPSDKEAKKQALIALVEQRKDAMKIAMQYDPQAAANDYLPQDTRDKLPEEAKGDLEQQAEIEGTWIKGFIDDHTSAIQTVTIKFGNNSKIQIYGKQMPEYTSGAPVEVTGIQIDDQLAVALPEDGVTQATVLSLLTGKAKAQITNPLISCSVEDCTVHSLGPLVVTVADQDQKLTRTVAVAAFRLPGRDGGIFADGKPYTIEEIEAMLQRVENIYTVMSYGKFAPNFEVYPEYIDMEDPNGEYGSFDCENGFHSTLTGLADRTIDNLPQEEADKFNNADDIMYLYNDVDCSSGSKSAKGWSSGASNYGESSGYSDTQGQSNIILETDFGESIGWSEERIRTGLVETMAHEVGHTYGLEHAKIACFYYDDEQEHCGNHNDNNLSNDQKKAVIYGDDYSLMGGHDWFDDDSISISAEDKESLGWLGEDDILEIKSDSSSTQVTLNALGQQDGTRAIKTNDGEYYIEYRPKTNQGLDNFVDDNLKPGLIVRRWSELLGGVKTNDYFDWGNNDQYRGYILDYKKAGIQEPISLEINNNYLCVNPSNATEDSIDISIHIGEDCPEYETVLSSSKDEVLADNPVSYWRFEETTGSVAKDEMNNHDGVISGAVTKLVTGPPGGGLAFNFGENASVDIGNQPDLSTREWSLGAWFKPNTYNPYRNNYIYRNRYWGWGMTANIGSVAAFSHNCVDPCASESYSTSVRYEDYDIGADKWHYAAIVKDESSLTLYVDGMAVDSKPADPMTYYIQSGGIAIGQGGNCNCFYFDGAIDEVAVFNKPLSADRIQAHSTTKGDRIIYRELSY
ncbi:hypothetical protein KC950_02810 [Candidatus Saccharibacteria bacterium]|nr:hypothetical protein [Candidatus Saccharibacteria bacterium]